MSHQHTVACVEGGRLMCGMTDQPTPAGLPPGPYRLVWPPDQGALFEVWGRQGTPPDFADGWAIPFVARAPQSVAEWLVDTLNGTTQARTEALDVAAERVSTMPTARIISQWDLVSRKAVLAILKADR